MLALWPLAAIEAIAWGALFSLRSERPLPAIILAIAAATLVISAAACGKKGDLLPPPGTPLWRGPWQWAVYEVNDWRQAQDLAERGLGWIETRAVEAMVKGRQAG